MALLCRAGLAAASVLVFATIGAQANPFSFQVNSSPMWSLGSSGPPVAQPRAITTPQRAPTVVRPAAVAKPKPKPVVVAKPATVPAETKIPVVAKTDDAAELTGEKVCARELAAIEPRLRKTLMRVTLAEKANETERCSAFREHAEIASKARDLFARCSSGRDRQIDVEQMDGALLRARFIMTRMCPRTGTQASAAPLQTSAQP
jgi:hypothetical protein